MTIQIFKREFLAQVTDQGKHVILAVSGKKTLGDEPDNYALDSHPQYTLGIIEFYFYIASFKLCADENSLEIANTLEQLEDLGNIRNTFTYDNPFILVDEIWKKVGTKKERQGGDEDDSAKRDGQAEKRDEKLAREGKRKIGRVKDDPLKLLDLTIFCVAISTLIKLCTSAYFHHSYDMALDADKPMVREGANRTNKCALESDIYFQDPINHERLEELKNWLEFIGDSVMNSFGASTIFYGTVGASVLLFYVMPILVMGPHRIRIDLASFIIDPKLERLRIDYELSIVIKNLVRSAFNYSKVLEWKKAKSIVNSSEEAEELKTKQQREKYGRQRRVASILMPSLATIGDGDITDFIKLLLGGKLRGLVRPVTLTSRWYSVVAFWSPIFLVCHNLFAHIVTWLVQWALIVGNLVSRTQQKLDSIECKLWHEKAIAIQSTNLYTDFHPSLKKSSLSESEDEDLRAYLAHDGSDWNLMKLAFFVEAKSFFTSKIILDIILIMITGLAATTWVSLYLWMHFGIHIDKLAWLNQIRNQITYCSSLLEKQEKHELLQKNLDEAMASSQCENFREKKTGESYEHLQIVEKITVCYLNFELFRRQQRNYQKLASFTSAQATIHAGVCLILSYFVGANLSIGKSGMILFMSTYMVGFVNTFLMCGALVTNRMNKLMKCAMTLVAKGSRSSIKSSYVLHLWRRQTLDEKELKKLYAPNIFGMLVSFETMVSFNFYLAFIYLVVLLKVNR